MGEKDMARTVKMGSMKMTLRHAVYAAPCDGERIVIETNNATVVIRNDGSVHVMRAISTTAYKTDNERVSVY